MDRTDRPAAQRRPVDAVVRVFDRDDGITGRVERPDGTVAAWLEGTLDRDGTIRVTELGAATDTSADSIRDLLSQAERGGEIRPSFRLDRATPEHIDGRSDWIDLLEPSASSQAVWDSLGRTGPIDHQQSVAADTRRALIDLAESQLAQLTGEPAPDLGTRVEFLDDAAFDDLIPDRRVLGAYSPDTGRLIVRTSIDVQAAGSLVHEGLHALRHERALQSLPRAFDEALTEHYTRLADPHASRHVERYQLDDGTTVFAVPGLPDDGYIGDSRLIAAPTPYADRLPFVDRLEQQVGRTTLWEFYRTGQPDSIRLTYERRNGPGSWTRLMDRAQRGDWNV